MMVFLILNIYIYHLSIYGDIDTQNNFVKVGPQPTDVMMRMPFYITPTITYKISTLPPSWMTSTIFRDLIW